MNNIKEYYKDKIPKFLQYQIPDAALGINDVHTCTRFYQCTESFLADDYDQCKVYYVIALIYRY